MPASFGSLQIPGRFHTDLPHQGVNMKLKESFKFFITAPDYIDEQSRRVSDLLYDATVLLLCGMTLLLAQLLWSGQYGKVTPVMVGLGIMASSVVVNRKGMLQVATNLTIWGITGFLMYMAFRYDGVHDTAILAIPAVLVGAGLVLKRRVFLLFSVTTIATVAGIGFLELQSVIQTKYSSVANYGDIFDCIVILGVTAAAIRKLSDSLDRSYARALFSEREVQRQAQALSESELRYRTLFESANDAIMILSDSKFVECNSMAVRMFGFESDARIVGRYPWELSPSTQPDGSPSQEKARRIMEAAVAGTPQRYRWKNMRSDGTSFDAEISLKCLRYGTEVLLQAMVTDITERVLAENTLRESREKFEKIFHSSPVPMSINRLADGMFVDVNHSYLDLLCLRREEIVGRSAEDRQEGFGGDLYNKVVEKLKTESSVHNLESTYRSTSGKVGHSLVSAETIELDGEPSVLSVIVNISDRKKAEEELRKSEELYRTLVSASPDAITVIDKLGKIVFASEKALGLFGEETLDQVLGRRLADWIDVNDPGRNELNTGEFLYSNTPPVRQYHMVRRDGSRRLVEVSAQAFPDTAGNVDGYVSFVRDVTERTKAEREVEEKERLYRALFDLSPGGIILTDLEGNILDANAAASTTNGYTSEELLGKNVRMLVPDADQEQVEENIKALQQGEVLDHEVVNVRKDGSLCNVELRETMISLPNGEKGILSITNNITSRKSAEAALQESEKRYRTLVEVSPDAIIIHQDFRIVFANPAALSLLAVRTLDEVYGKSVLEFIEESKHRLMRDRYRALIESNLSLPFVEIKFIRTDGTSVDVESTAIPTTWKGRQAAQMVIHDLRERKKAENAIQESEERFRNLTRAAFEGIAVHEQGMIIDTNQRFADMIGFRNPEMLAGKRILDVLRMVPDSKLRFKEALEQDSDTPFEITVLRPDGISFPAETQSRKTMYLNRPASVVTLHDITKRKLAERAMMESEERFRALVQNSSDVISIHNDKGIIIYISPSVSRILGYKSKDLVGLSAFEFIHPDDLAAVKKDFRELIEDRKDNVPTHYRFRAADGSWKYLESFATNLVDAPAIKGYVLNTRDVTERRRAEEALRESEERFRLLIENSTDLIAEISEEGRFVYVSPNYENTLGYKPTQLTGRSAFEHVNPEDLPKVLSKFQGDHGTEVFRVRHCNGTWRWIEASGRRFRTPSGEERSVTMSRDVTDRKLAEEELNKSRTQLQRFSEHLENTLDEERKRISREIHDELGQLLTILKFDLSWLKLNTRVKSKEFPGKIESMENSLSQALASVKRISKELRPPQLEELGLVGAIQLDISLIERKVGLATRVRIDPVDFTIDKQLSTTIYRVFHEVLTNIVRHADAKNVDVLLQKNPKTVVLRVADDGRGITSKELEGTMSLGLVGMRERVRQWNGTLTIVGRKGEGTTVTASFPS